MDTKHLKSPDFILFFKITIHALLPEKLKWQKNVKESEQKNNNTSIPLTKSTLKVKLGL